MVENNKVFDDHGAERKPVSNGEVVYLRRMPIFKKDDIKIDVIKRLYGLSDVDVGGMLNLDANQANFVAIVVVVGAVEKELVNGVLIGFTDHIAGILASAEGNGITNIMQVLRMYDVL